MRITRNCLLLAGVLASGLLAGCNEDVEIRHYQVARPEPKPLNRVLGAIFPEGNGNWFFKLVGPAPLIDKHAREFEQFAGSVHLTGKADKPLTWEVPPGWREGPANQMRYATFYLDAGDSVELTVSSAGGSLADNVNRWRKQLNLPDMSEEDQARFGHVTVNGVTVTMVDLSGTGSGRTKMGGRSMQGGGADPHAGMAVPPPAAAAAPPLRYTVPSGWKEAVNPSGSSIRVASFEVAEGDRKADISISPLSGTGGGLEENVNIWRGQIGLAPTTADQVRKDVRPIEVAGTSGQYVDLTAPAQGNRPALRMLVVMLPHGGQTWFFKMNGPAELVGKQQSAFDAFVQSVRFESGKGAKP